MAHTIELRKVSKFYATEDSVSMGFSRIDLTLDIGEFVAITGESGSGKSTLLNVLSGLDTYEEGEMFVCGEDTTAYGTQDYERYRKTYIGNIFQDFNLINSYSVYQNIELVMLLSGKKKRECRARILELIDLVGLTQYRRTKVSRLSGGQKQRVAIARALAKDAPIIVADEPTGNLDSASAANVMETLSKVSADKLVIIVTHNYDQAEPYVTRKLTMHDGRIIEDKKFDPPAARRAANAGAGGDFHFEDDAPASAGWTSLGDTEAEAEDKGSLSSAAAAEGAREEQAAELRGESGDDAARAPDKASERSSEGKRGSAAPKDYSNLDELSVDRVRMSILTELRLGIRNTFNLPAKFILLFIVYLFVSTAILSQYATTQNSMHQSDILGYNQYFTNSSPDRIIVKKADETAFSQSDIEAVRSSYNIDHVVLNDLAVDKGVSYTLNDSYVEGPVYPASILSEDDLTYGHLPENDYEIVISADTSSDAYYSISEYGEELIGSSVKLADMWDTMQIYDFGRDLKVAGIIIDDSETSGGNANLMGYSYTYVSDKIANELLVFMMANASKTELNFGGNRVRAEYEGEKMVYTSPLVPEGKAYIFEDQTYYYKDEKAVDQPLGISVSNRFFSAEKEFVIADVITEKNINKLTGVAPEEFDMYYNAVYINDTDFRKLFDKGNFQISAYMSAEADSDPTIKALNEKGFTTLALKDALTDMTGGFDYVLQLITYGRLLIEFIILFFIAYAVIRIIMRSRNSYYSTLRILGATKRNTDAILRVELILMMVISYSVDIAVVILVKLGYIRNSTLSNLLYFLTVRDYAALGILLLAMSVLIAARYSRKIFTKSAMKTFRGEVQ